MEFISDYNVRNALFGIANVESSSGCSRTVGYYLSEMELTLLLPPSCQSCRKAPICSKEFGVQIIQKYNQKHRGTELPYFLF